jgi:predicted DNA-binding ribbon-helix-helix protein
MQLQGTQESYDLAMEAYNQLPADKRKVFVEGEEVSADTLIKEIDDQLEDINNLIRCVRGE